MNRKGIAVVCFLALQNGTGLQATQATSATRTSASIAASYAAIDRDWHRCLDGDTSGSDRYVMACHYDAKERLFVLLDDVVAARQSGLSPAERRKFDRNQALWSKHAIGKCASDPWYRFNGGGTKYPGTAAFVEYGFCIIRATQKRIAALTRDAR